MEDIWIRTDTDREGVDGLEMAVEQLHLVAADPYRWKWVILAVHNALTCFMCVTLEGSDKLGAMDDRYIKTWREACDKGQRPPNQQENRLKKLERLADFPELFKRVQSRRWVAGYVDSTPLQPTQDQARAVQRLNNWRTSFVHYKPIGLSIEVRGFPEIIERCLEVVEFLAFQSHHVLRGTDELAERTKAALVEARDLLRDINQRYERG
jgi:hypothetical protein